MLSRITKSPFSIFAFNIPRRLSSSRRVAARAYVTNVSVTATSRRSRDHRRDRGRTARGLAEPTRGSQRDPRREDARTTGRRHSGECCRQPLGNSPWSIMRAPGVAIRVDAHIQPRSHLLRPGTACVARLVRGRASRERIHADAASRRQSEHPREQRVSPSAHRPRAQRPEREVVSVLRDDQALAVASTRSMTVATLSITARAK